VVVVVVVIVIGLQEMSNVWQMPNIRQTAIRSRLEPLKLVGVADWDR